MAGRAQQGSGGRSPIKFPWLLPSDATTGQKVAQKYKFGRGGAAKSRGIDLCVYGLALSALGVRVAAAVRCFGLYFHFVMYLIIG